jgi:hypothetical protein
VSGWATGLIRVHFGAPMLPPPGIAARMLWVYAGGKRF